MTFRFRVLGAVVAPLLLAGCGMPVGVQVASLLADGISLLTTEKTLTDHGLSAATGEDCAMWRGLEGQDICREDPDAETQMASNEVPVTDASPLMGDSDVADYAGPVIDPEPTAVVAAEPASGWRAPERATPWHEPVDPRTVAAAGPEWAPAELAKAGQIESAKPEKADKAEAEQTKVLPAPVVEAKLEPLKPIGTGAAPALPGPIPAAELAKAEQISAAELAPTAEPAKAGQIESAEPAKAGTEKAAQNESAVPALPKPIAEPAEAKTAATVTRVPAEAAPRGGVFYVIGSYRRLAYAERFAGRQKGLDMLILSGALKGRPIYRVAVGPVPEARRGRVHERLVAAGHADAWALTLKAPRVAAELAQLN